MKYLALILALLSVTTGNAQIRRTPVPKTVTIGDTTIKKDEKKDALKSIGLTKEQKGQVKEIRADIKARKAVIKSDSTMASRERKIKLNALTAEEKQRILLLLTDQQKQQLIIEDPGYGDMVPMPKRGNSGMINERTTKEK